MSVRARAFVAVVLALGVGAAWLAVAGWTSSGLPTFAIFFVACIATSLWRLTLPGIEGSLSVAYVFLLWGIARLGLGETMLVGTVSTLVQSYWRAKRKPRVVQVAFNAALIILSIGVGRFVFTSRLILAPKESLRILLVSVAYFLVNTSCVASVIGLTEGRAVWNVWRGSYLWTLPHYLLGATVVVVIEALRKAIGIETVLLVVPVAYLVYHTFQMHLKSLRHAIERAELEKRHAEAAAELHLRTIRALALAIEAKDHTTAEHLHRVQTYALELGKEFRLPPEEMEALRAAAILHDIGKIAVPEDIISKPAKLTPEEFGKMKIHPIVGAEIIESIKFPFAVGPLVRAHHEKWDGSGYPEGLKGEEIPLAARILTTVDCFDALASDRQYRKALPLDQAMAVVAAESGKSFDPQVVDVLGRRYRELEQLARATLDSANLEFSTELNVQRGSAPDAGFAKESEGHGGSATIGGEVAVMETSAIREIHAEIDRLDSLPRTLAAIRVSLSRIIPFDCLALWVKRGETLRCAYVEGLSAEFLSDLAIPVGVGVSGWVVTSGKPLLNGNALTEFGVSSAVPPGFRLQTGLGVALDWESGPSAVLTLYSRVRDGFSGPHLRLLLAIESSLAYYLRLVASGLTDSALEATPPSDLPVSVQLELLSEQVRSGSVQHSAVSFQRSAFGSQRSSAAGPGSEAHQAEDHAELRNARPN